ncbi:hypothetical protein BWQ96_04881 [Gracilariopsis chorda]|uniref:Uncharacterized protein n=1 Tax=Gracilariopsis chorda TaxID=448386 RepID=A0A2V3ITB6_9FLOR|nr:hypothetical protein BWQ96_04881 [Gracilariopsis chorda]|eukprot:PXF45361.1 hypothetical protein BWQ96_04881 [Gracilariopsis chorda]
MTSIQIPVSSAVINLVNIVFLQLVFAPVVTLTTSSLGGYDNYERMKRNGSLSLETFDAPVVGENLIMSKGFQRRLLIAIRVSIVLAIGISNVGLEGRSGPRKLAREGLVHAPGPIPRAVKNITLLQERLVQNLICNVILDDGATYVFGSVVDGKCHRELTEYTYIKEMGAALEDFNISTGKCDIVKSAERIIHKCQNSEFVCNKGASESGRKRSLSETCVALRYSTDGKRAWQCENAVLGTNARASLGSCRRLTVRREHLRWWSDAKTRFELTGMHAVFASAYGVPREQNIEIEDGEREVTIVTLFWILPTAWILIVVFASLCRIAWKRNKEGQAVAHDERKLFSLLDKTVMITEENECLVSFN